MLLLSQRADEDAGDNPDSSAGNGQRRWLVWSAQV